MKKTITTLAVGGSLLVAVPAEAAPAQVVPVQAVSKDPVRALKGKLATGRGVRFTETTTLSGDDKTEVQSRKGTFQFNAKGLAGSDIVATSTLGRERTITVGKVGYTSGGIWKDRLPAGKTWLKGSGSFGGTAGYRGQVINPAEPKTLAALIKKGKLTRSSITGKITFKELDKVSPWFAGSIPLRMHDDTKVSYTLTLTSAGLVSKVKSSYAATGILDVNGHDGKTITIESRFTGWGTKVSIKAPNPKTVTTKTLDD
ncbi:hypothetical protein [Nonomuraea cavernae]|uniref:hypothetical protein n=1 Tax=Nonomuraea cavernae TaxID=2045107 RepID=UPI0033C4AAE8